MIILGGNGDKRSPGRFYAKSEGVNFNNESDRTKDMKGTPRDSPDETR